MRQLYDENDFHPSSLLHKSIHHNHRNKSEDLTPNDVATATFDTLFLRLDCACLF